MMAVTAPGSVLLIFVTWVQGSSRPASISQRGFGQLGNPCAVHFGRHQRCLECIRRAVCG